MDATVTLTVRVIPEQTELQSLAQSVLGSERSATQATLTRYLQPEVRSALATQAGAAPAGDLIDGPAQAAAAPALARAVQGPCFTAGLALVGQPVVQFASTTYQQVRRSEEQAARQQREQEAARQVQRALEQAQREHLDHLARLLSDLREQAARTPQTDLADLVKAFPESQRSELYHALFASAQPTARTAWIVVVAGDEVLFYDPQQPGSPRRRLPVCGEAGPVRSVQLAATPTTGRWVALLGAATGVYVLPPDASGPTETFVVPDAPPVRGGFNAVALVGERILGTHSELGLVEWSTDGPKAAQPRFTQLTSLAQAVRCLQRANGELYCSIDDRVARWPVADRADVPAVLYPASGARVTALCPSNHGLYVGDRRGQVWRWASPTDTSPQLVHAGRGKPAESVLLRTTAGVPRLIFTDNSSYVYARVLADNYTCHYEAPGWSLRRVAVADDLVVATNDLRDRLICWRPGQPSTPYAIIPVSALCGRSIQDVCLVPAENAEV